MTELSTSLLREKFVIHEQTGQTREPVTALSNRLVSLHQDKNGNLLESFAVRTQNMHTCIRFSAQLLHAFQENGPLMSPENDFDWEDAWQKTLNDYEKEFNPDLWAAVYYDGKLIFEKGTHHPFLDVIEKCDAHNEKDYDDSVRMAEAAFKKKGKTVKIDYDGNVALVANIDQEHGRCGIILRSGGRTKTFNFTLSKKRENYISFVQCLMACAAYLEGIQLSFVVGLNKEKIDQGLIKKKSKEEEKTKEAVSRLNALDAEIANFENDYTVNYRPEKPRFEAIIQEARQTAQSFLKKS